MTPDLRHELVVFSKHDCPLCDELKDRLKGRNIPFAEHDIRSRRDWFDRYGQRVPVVLLPHGEEFDPPFSNLQLESWSALYR